jgi:hypothetical protein
MKKLLILFGFVTLIGCGDKEKEEEQQHIFNVVFYRANNVAITVNGITRIVLPDPSNMDPQCDAYWDTNSKNWAMYLKEGVYPVTVNLNSGAVTRNITVHEDYCNRFNVSQIYGWQ